MGEFLHQSLVARVVSHVGVTGHNQSLHRTGSAPVGEFCVSRLRPKTFYFRVGCFECLE